MTNFNKQFTPKINSIFTRFLINTKTITKKLLVVFFTIGLVTSGSALLVSCDLAEDSVAELWTNSTEFVSYAEAFNASQNRYKVVVKYRNNTAQALLTEKEMPDIVVGPYLKSQKTRQNFTTLDYLFAELSINKTIFYPQLLEPGRIQGYQYLLPVNFNFTAVIFPKNSTQLTKTDFILPLSTIQKKGATFNEIKNDSYTKMGFIPRSNPNFLYTTCRLFGSDFKEGGKLFTWNEKNLQEAIKYLKNWTQTVNTSTAMEDEFQFKYMYDPAYKLVTGNRVLMSALNSKSLFVLPADKLSNIDFRWLTKDDTIPVTEGTLYIGICKNGKNRKAARAFVSWFFKVDTQNMLLERSKKLGLLDTSFGIAGGFSSLKEVNESALLKFYPVLLGHLPQLETIQVPQVLPSDWENIKKTIIMPFLQESLTAENSTQINSLEKRISLWTKEHPQY